MKKNIYTTIFIFISCVLFLFFIVGLFRNPYGPQRLIFFQGILDFFADFYNVLHYIADRNPYFNPRFGPGAKTYFPLTYLILYPFSQLDDFATMSLQEAWNSRIGLVSVFLFTCFSVFLLLTALNQIAKKYLVSPLLLISLVLSYIFFCSIERGNMAVLSAACIGFFICYYDSKNKYKRMLAVISLALAATFKIFPVLFGFLYFEKKQYREILLSAIITLVLVFLPFLFLKGGFSNIPQLVRNMGFSVSPSGSLDPSLQSGSSAPIDPSLKSGSSAPIDPSLPSGSTIPPSSSLPRIITFFYPSNNYFVSSYTRFSVPHLIYYFLSQFKFHENIEYDEVIKFSLSNIAQIITYFLCLISIVFSCLIKDKWWKISLLTIALVFFPVDSGLYCGLYIFPMIIIFFGTLEKRSTVFNVFAVIVFLVFLNPYQIIINYTLAGYLTSYNYIFINIALIMFWLVLLVYSGMQLVLFYSIRKSRE